MTTTLRASSTLPEDVAAVVRSEMERWSVPGAAVGVLRDGTVETLATGVVSVETGFPVRPDTLFQTGSISKIVTTTLVLQLVDEGRIDLDAPVVTYLPSLTLSDPDATRSLTMRHLLTHTGGFFGDRFDNYGANRDALALAVANFGTLRQYTPPGASWAYSNIGFQLAGRVVEYLRGRSFEALARERVFEPLGMQRSMYLPHAAITYPIALGHHLQPDGQNQQTHTWGPTRAGDTFGGLISCVGDLLRFAAAHLAGGALDGVRVLSVASAEAMQTPWVESIQAGHWGLGWWIEIVDGVKVVGHGGVINGIEAQLALVPSRGVAFAFLLNGNQGGPVIRAVQKWMYAHYLGLNQTESPALEVDEATLRRLAGRYEGALNNATVAVDGRRLRLLIESVRSYTPPGPPAEAHALPIEGKRFRFVDGTVQGTCFDFLDQDGDGADAPPRYLRLDNRLLDRVG